MAKLTIEDVLKQFSFEEIKAAQLAKQQKELQPRKDKLIADFEAVKKEYLAILELDENFPKPWKSSAKKASSGKGLQEGDLLTIQNLVKDEPRQLKDVATALGSHHLTVKKFLDSRPAFKISKKNNKSMVSYMPAK